MMIRRFKKEKGMKSKKVKEKGRDTISTCFFSTQKKILFPRREEHFCASPLSLSQISAKPLRIGMLKEPTQVMTEEVIEALLTPTELRRVHQQINRALFGTQRDSTQTLECLVERETWKLYAGKIVFLLGTLRATKKHSALMIIGIDGVFWSPSWTVVPCKAVVLEE